NNLVKGHAFEENIGNHKDKRVGGVSRNTKPAKEGRLLVDSPRYNNISDLLLPARLLQYFCHHEQLAKKVDKIKVTTCNIEHIDSVG
ncbi:hypothetical protein KI387_004200, partial [Taxus chinensis]